MITTTESDSVKHRKNHQKRLEQFIIANHRYLEKGNNREIHRERTRNYARKYYGLKREIKRLSSISV
jgi:hypothetical protein